jgi:hypothetical protein
MSRREPGRGGPAKGAGTGGPASGRPAEPYGPGNLESLRHGVFSDRVRNEVTTALLEELRRDHGALWLNALDASALEGYLAAEAAVRSLRVYVGRQGHQNVPALSDLLRRWEGRAAAARDALGLSPASRGRLARDVGAGAAGAAAAAALARITETGRQALQDRGWLDDQGRVVEVPDE